MIQLIFTLPVAGPVTADLDVTPQSCQEKNDGIQFIIFVVDEDGFPINLLSASSKKIKFLTPDGKTIEKPAGFFTSGVDGALEYTTTKTDLPQDGTYQIQADYTLGGSRQTTRVAKFRVGDNLDE